MNDILSQILCLNPLYFQQLYFAHFSFILNDFKGYKCVISKYINFFKIKIFKNIVEELKLQNHVEHLWKNPKHSPLDFDKAYLAHFPLDCSIFYKYGYAKWKTTILF
jgi:hypothetical protein